MTLSASPPSAFRSTAYLGLGSNLEHPDWQVRRSLAEIDDIRETALSRVSSLYQTTPVGVLDQPPFVNAVVKVDTTLAPRDLLAELLSIEGLHHRVRGERNGPRTLDIDILIFNEWRIDEDGLTLPHPRMHERAFVLVPLVEIAPDVYVPGKGFARDLLAGLDTAGVHRLEQQ